MYYNNNYYKSFKIILFFTYYDYNFIICFKDEMFKNK